MATFQIGWTTDYEQLVSLGGGAPDGSITLSLSGSLLSATWTRPGDWWDKSGLRVDVTCPNPITQVVYRVRRLELNPTVSSEWWLPGNSYADLAGLLRPDPGGTLTLLGNDEAWAYFQMDYATPTTITSFKSYGDGFRGVPSQTGFPNTNHAEFEIVLVTGPVVPPSGPSPHDPGSGGAPGPDGECQAHNNEATDPPSGNPIRLRDGDKILAETDLMLQSSPSPLSFVRSYIQSKQSHGDFQFMGLGWTHNHALKLSVQGVAPNRTAEVILTRGGILRLDEDSQDQGHFDARAGSNAELDYDSGQSEYTLMLRDTSTYVFDASTGQAKSRHWPSGEAWTYTYSSGKLVQVADDYGRSLAFRYITSGSHAGQLYRVGDHTFDDTNPSSPTGRYVEFGYTLNKIVDTDGDIVNGSNSLLTSVQDVNGNTWDYTYYAETNQFADVRQLNFLVKRESPSVDTDGDQTADGELVLEDLTYTMQGTELAVNGDMELASNWSDISGSEPTSNDQSTTQVDAGTYSRYVDCSTANEGIEGEQWDIVNGCTYVVVARIYPVSGSVKMQVPGQSAFERTTSGTGAWQTVRAVHQATANDEDVTLQFVADGGAADFYVDMVSIIETDLSVDAITQKRGGDNLITDFAFGNGEGYFITTETITNRQKKHHYLHGVYSGEEDPYGNIHRQFFNTDYRPAIVRDANSNSTALTWSSNGKLLTQVKDALANTTDFNYNSNDTLNYSLDEEGRKTQYVYGDTQNNPRLPTEVKVIDVDGTTVLRWQKFEYDTQGHPTVEKTVEPATGTTELQKTTRTYYATGNGDGLLESVTQVDIENSANNQTTTYTYDTFGRVVKTGQTSLLGNCQYTYTVYDAAGQVLATVCTQQNTTPPTTVTAALALYDANDAVKKHARVTTHDYDTLGRRVATTTDAAATFAQTSLTFYDALGRVWRTIANYQSQSTSAPGDWVWDTNDKRWEYDTNSAVSHGDNNHENIIADTHYNDLGLVRLRRNVLGQVTLYGYDDVGQLVKTVQNAATPGYNNDFSGTSPDPDLSAYPENTTNSDVDIITEQVYDAAGNLVKAIDPLGHVTLTGYDELNRPIKMIRAASDKTYAWANDLKLASYPVSDAPDADLIEETVYDDMGRVQSTTRVLDTRGSQFQTTITRYVYDGLDRQALTIANYVEQGTPVVEPEHWEWANGQWEDGSSNAIDHGNNDQNLISETIYDDAGRVKSTRDVLRLATQQVYDGLGHQTLAIASYQVQGDPADWVWDDTTDDRWEDSNGDPILFGTHNDENSLAQTLYDDNGRVQATRDVAGKLTWQVYDDDSGQQVKTIVNYVPQGSTDPADWVWDDTDGRWERGASDNTAIERTTTYFTNKVVSDINLISATTYDDRGRVTETRDARGNVTYFVYDAAGRRIRTIANYVPQGSTDPADWVWDDTDGRWERGASDNTAIVHGSNNDQNRIADTEYDPAGRVFATRDAAGLVTRFIYDALGRRIRTVTNYVAHGNPVVAPENWVWANNQWEDGSNQAISHGAGFDQNLISATVYNKAGQVVSSRDIRGTQTTFIYDDAGRRLQVEQAAGSALKTIAYTCYNKAGQVLRTIAHWQDDGTSPDEQAANGTWVFAPDANHGRLNDQNRSIEYAYDGAGRRVTVIDPVGNVTVTTFRLDGQVDTVTDPEGIVALYRYDQLRRRKLVVQNYAEQGASDPTDWVWDDTTDDRWEDGSNNAIDHQTDDTGDNEDQNIIVQAAYDILGRRTSLRDPRGNLTQFVYDQLGRRIKLTNPLSKDWITVYEDADGTSAGETMTKLIDPKSVTTQRDSDRLGRPITLGYGDATNTYDVTFTYDLVGNRIQMTEDNGSSDQRITGFEYDQARRLTQATFDTDGDSTVDETVSYAYGLGGQRTQLTLPGSLDITYRYDPAGRLISLTDWDGQQTQFAYDHAHRLVAAERTNGLASRYTYDAAGRLRLLRHLQGRRTLAHFAYEVDGRGNRTQALELLAHPTTTNDISYNYDDASIVYQGTWTDDASTYQKSDDFSAALKLAFFGQATAFTFGTGVNHSIFDVYINGSLWQSFDGYATTSGEQTVDIDLTSDGPHIFELRNRPEHSLAAEADAGYDEDTFIVRFKQLRVPDMAYDLRTLEYTYDALSRLTETRVNPGLDTGVADADLLHRYVYAYDKAGNRTHATINGGSVTVTPYNAANQISHTGFTYDDNGNLTSDGTNTYTWDRANRLTSMGNSSYAYDGLGNRLAQTASSITTQYLLDLQPGLVKVLAATTSGNTDRFIHGPRGIHAQEDNSGVWTWPLQDGLGSVRGEISDTAAVNGVQSYAPYGDLVDGVGAIGSPFRFTGEQLDDNGLLYLRARYYSPELGVFTGLDPVEFVNRYQYVNANPVNMVDLSGMYSVPSPSQGDSCSAEDDCPCNIPDSFVLTDADFRCLMRNIEKCSGWYEVKPCKWRWFGASPASTPNPGMDYRLTDIDWIGSGVWFATEEDLSELAPEWGDRNCDIALLALDLIVTSSNKTPGEIINWIAADSQLPFLPMPGNSIGGGYDRYWGGAGRVLLQGADVPRLYHQPYGLFTILSELAHGIDESENFTIGGGFNIVGWNQSLDGTWEYTGNPVGNGPASEYAIGDNPGEDFADSFAAVVIALNQTGLTSKNGINLSNIVAFTGEFVQVGEIRRQIIMRHILDREE